MALKLLLLSQQEFGSAFQEVTKNAVLLTNLRQKLNFDIHETTHENFAKILSIKETIHSTGYLSIVDASAICKSLFKDHKAETSQLIYNANYLTGFCVMRGFAGRHAA